VRNLLANLGLAAGSILFMLIVFEVGLRLAGYGAIYEVYSKPWIFWVHDDLLGWSHEPNAEGVYVGPRPWPVEFETPIRINSLGLRGPEPAPRTPGSRRVMVLGDSMVVAFEVPWQETFTSLLEERLSAARGAPVEVVNAGVRGYGTDQSYLYYRERGRKLAPDLVILVHGANDPLDNTTLHEMRRPLGKAAFELEPDGKLELVGAPVPRYPICSEFRLAKDIGIERIDGFSGRLLCRAQTLLFDRSALFGYLTMLVPWDSGLLMKLYYVGNPHLASYYSVKNDAPHSFAELLTTALVIQLAAEVTRDGAGFLLVGQDDALPTLDAAPLARAGIEPVSLGGAEGASYREIRFKHDNHYNRLGHVRVADLLAPVVLERLARRPDAG
jgi:hypothetical protein